MGTQLLGKIKLDDQRLADDLRTLDTTEFSQAYTEFACGRWDTCVLRNSSGSSSEQKIKSYDTKALPTPLSKTIPYINELIEEQFQSDRIRYARVMRIGPNSCIIPHQDYLEIDDEYVRVHAVIKTNDRCWNTEEDKIYHMDKGEVWFLDATRVHSAGCFGETDRLHLVIDFHPGTDLHQITASTVLPAEMDLTDPRPHMPAEIQNAIHGLAVIISRENFRDIVAILSKFHFLYRSHAKDVYNWLLIVCERSGSADMVRYAQEVQKYYILERQPDSVPAI